LEVSAIPDSYNFFVLGSVIASPVVANLVVADRAVANLGIANSALPNFFESDNPREFT